MNNKNELVVYTNEFNTIPLRNFNGSEMDLLFTIMSQMRDKGLTEIDFKFSELKYLSNYSKTSNKEFIKLLEQTYDKLISLNVKIGTSKKWTKFVFFTKYSVDEEEQTISIAVNSEFAPLINELTGNFTRFELEEVTALRSSYSKAMYRLLKQFRKTGLYIVNIEDFRYLLDIPESYQMRNITQKVLDPIERELEPYFKDLYIEKIRSIRDKRKIERLRFTFEAQSDVKKGSSTFRNKDGGYKDRKLLDFTNDEIIKEFPELSEALKDELDQAYWSKKQKEENLSNEDIERIKNAFNSI